MQRRKIIYNNLQNALKDKELALQMLEKAGIAPSKRAQQCQLEDFMRLFEANESSLIAAYQNQS